MKRSMVRLAACGQSVGSRELDPPRALSNSGFGGKERKLVVEQILPERKPGDDTLDQCPGCHFSSSLVIDTKKTK